MYDEAPKNQVDPTVAALEQRLSQIEGERRAHQAETFLANAFAQIESQHGEFDRAGVRELMIQKGISDPEIAYAAFHFGAVQQTAETTKAAVEKDVRRRARNASRPHRVGAKVPDRGPSKPPGDLDRTDAIKMALSMLRE